MTDTPFETSPAKRYTLAIILLISMRVVPMCVLHWSDEAFAFVAWVEVLLLFLLAALVAPRMYPWAGRAAAGWMLLAVVPAFIMNTLKEADEATPHSLTALAQLLHLVSAAKFIILIAAFGVLGVDLRRKLKARAGTEALSKTSEPR